MKLELLIGMLKPMLEKFLLENGGVWSIAECKVNEWMDSKKLPFELTFDIEGKKFSIRLKK